MRQYPNLILTHGLSFSDYNTGLAPRRWRRNIQNVTSHPRLPYSSGVMPFSAQPRYGLIGLTKDGLLEASPLLSTSDVCVVDEEMCFKR
jgi:hypothetical protein